MASVATQMSAQLRQLVFYHMDNESLDNANFLAGRLVALDPRNADSLHLLALSYFKMGRYKAAHELSAKYGSTGKHLGCAYVYALSCEALEEYTDGVTALDKAKALWLGRNHWNKHSDTSRKHLPDAGMVWNLLAKLWRGHGDLHRAGECFIEAHKLNPLIWESFTGLCDIGADVNIAACFKLTSDMVESSTTVMSGANGTSEDNYTAAQAIPMHMNGQLAVATPTNDPFITNSKTSSEWSFQFPKIKGKGMFGSPPKAVAQPSWETPTTNGNPDEDVEMGGIEQDVLGSMRDVPPPAPVRRSKTLSRLGFDNSKDPSRLQAPSLKSFGRTHSDTTDGEDTASQTSRATTAHKRTLSGHTSATSDASSQPRRSTRFLGQLTNSKPTTRAVPDSNNINAKREDPRKTTKPAAAAKGRGASTVGRVVSGNRKIMPPGTDAKDPRLPGRNSVSVPPVPAMKTAAETIVLPDTAAIENLLATFKQLGVGYLAQAQYDSKRSIEAYQALPIIHKDTAWVQGQLGKAYYEAAEYTKSEECFARMLKLQPSRIEDTEYYSTVLWQLKKPVQLSHLSHILKDLDYEAPQTWCAVGNAFSASREHQQAIVCFKRAVQMSPKFYYAWTLMGHELLTIENFDEAIRAYRKGVGKERRGYAGWYGLGKCFERMGKYEEAERHYRIAASINEQNHVLFICIGVVLERMKHRREALVQYTHAIQLCPTSAMGRFRKARTLMTLKLYSDALNELTELVSIAPEEANVWFMLGKCHKAQRNRGEALKCFTTALNLDAKATMYIKEAMEGIDDSDEEEDDSD
ncbi:bimA-like protein [Elsinoe australis]|uniref:BimA-like protein n=1 Tax=Elsinoe australis TaxID=40998 RepID=A0A4U7AYB7_9PEZI|nr:bimA-like protein [Elsinoe australis]